MWLGNWKNEKTEIGNIQWTTDPVKTLGIYFGHDKEQVDSLNWESKIKALEQCLQKWSHPFLSLPGRITVAKNLGISKIIYLSSVLPVSDEIKKKINALLFNYIWKGKRDKVKRLTMIGTKPKGGMSMIDYNLKDLALKADMLRRLLLKGNEKWKILPLHHINKFGENLLILKLNSKTCEHILRKENIPSYYKQLIRAWHKCKEEQNNMPTEAAKIRAQIIWGNKWVTSNGKTLWYKEWVKRKLIYLNDIYLTRMEILMKKTSQSDLKVVQTPFLKCMLLKMQ